MDGASGPFINYEVFENERFNVDSYVKKIAADSIYASNIADTRDKLNRNAQLTAEEIKQSVYKNYANFMETAKEVGHLESKMSQLRQSLDEQRKLLNLFKNLNINSPYLDDLASATSTSTSTGQQGSAGKAGALGAASSGKSSLAILLEQVEGCGLITQKPGRTLLYHSDLEALHLNDYSVSHKLHVYLLSDALLLTLPQRKRNKAGMNSSSTTSTSRASKNPLLMDTSGGSAGGGADSSNTYQYKFQAFYELQDVKIMNIDDCKEVRNAFQLLKFPESLAFRCPNAHTKKEWLENIESAKRQLQGAERGGRFGNFDLNESTIEEEDEDEENLSDDEDGASAASLRIKAAAAKKKKNEEKLNMSNLSEQERSKLLREQFSDFDILLAQRDFEKAVDTLLRIKQAAHSLSSSMSMSSSKLSSYNANFDVQQLIYKQKENELINVLRKDLVSSKDRGNDKGVTKTGKRVVNSLIKLKIYDEAIDLFIDYHKHLNAETLRKIKLEESNSVYMNNVLNLFFENLLSSFTSFREAFAGIINYCYSSYITWCDTEIEILIKKLQSQHYLGRHFNLTIENCELIFQKAKEFSEKNNFEVRFLFETKLSAILESSIKEQQDVLLDASLQRSKLELEQNPANTEQNRLVQIDKLIKDLELHGLLQGRFSDQDIKLIRECTASSVQFSRGIINFFCAIRCVYYQDINYWIVEAFTKLFKSEHKIYTIQFNKCSKQSANPADQSQSPQTKLTKKDIQNSVRFVEKVLNLIEKLYFEMTGVHSKHLLKVSERYAKFREENLS